MPSSIQHRAPTFSVSITALGLLPHLHPRPLRCPLPRPSLQTQDFRLVWRG